MGLDVVHLKPILPVYTLLTCKRPTHDRKIKLGTYAFVQPRRQYLENIVARLKSDP